MPVAASDVIRLWERLNGDRGTWMSHWQDAANHMLPERADFLVTKTPGQKRQQYIYDATPPWALQNFAAGLHSLLTSPTLQWFGLHVDDDKLNQRQDVRAWLDDTASRMYAIFNGPKHNFAAQSHELYCDLGCFGTAVMAELESARSGILFTTRHLKECVIAENEEDRVDTLCRKWSYTAKQAFEAWGKAAGEAVMKALADDKPETPFDFLHLVRPRRNRDPQRADRRNKPFESVYVCVTDKTVIDEGGFDEFPYHVPRFAKITGEIYGRGPGLTVLPDVKMLYQMVKTVLKSAQKIVDPPLFLPDDGFMVPIKTVPGSLNYYRAGMQGGDIKPLETRGDIPIGVELVNSLRQQILRGYYVEWLMMPSDPNDPAASGKGVTATYVLQQRDEKMRLLSPMLSRLQSEFLGPLIDRTFAIMWRQSTARRFGPGSPLSPPPGDLSGVPLRVEYVSPIAVAQKTSQLDSVGRLIQTALQLASVDPNAIRILDAEGILRLTARDLNAPAIALKSPEQLAQEREAEARAQQAAAQGQQLATLAQAANSGGAAAKNFAQAVQAMSPELAPQGAA